jgi:hypothetical protein
MGVAIAEHLAAGQDVHVLWVTRGKASAVLAKLNATSPTPNSWWGVMHVPEDEAYEVLTAEEFGEARIHEGFTAIACLASGYSGKLTLHEADLDDGTVTAAQAYDIILGVCGLINPTGPIRLKGHTWVSRLDSHPDHIAIGTAIKQLGVDDPDRFSDHRYYILPNYWNDPDLSLVDEAWDQPTNAGVAARAINACRAYGAWAPVMGRYAIGHHSTFGMFATVMAGPKCLFHT